MDGNRGQRRQTDVPIHSASGQQRYHPGLQDPSQQQPQPQQQPQQQQQQQQRRSFAGSSGAVGGAGTGDRYRPAAINTSSTGVARGMGGSAGYSAGYYQEPAAFGTPALQPSTMGYHQPGGDYGQADARGAQGFAPGTYNPTAIMYNVQQTAGAQGTAVYDTSQQFPSSRQAANLQMMSTDVASSYFSGEPTGSAAAAAAVISSGTAGQVYQQSAGPQGYPMGAMAAPMGSMPAQTTGPATQDVSMDGEYPVAGRLDEAYANYQAALKETFQNIRNSALESASESLLTISDWLLSHVAELGLTSDATPLYNDRIKLWDDFNHAWLALFQRQKEMMEPGQQLPRSQSLVSQEGLNRMGRELVRLCDGIERYGLVDYQYGVWEEQIVAILEDCLNLYELVGDDSGGAGTGTGSGSRHR